MKVDELIGRPAAYLNDSGLPWLTTGSAFVLMGTSQLIWPLLARSHPIGALVMQGGGTVAAMLILWAGLKLKQMVVFPRAGYAVPRHSPWIRVIKGLCLSSIVLVAMLARGGHRMPDLGRLSAPFFAVVFALLAVYTAWRGKGVLGYWFAIYLVCMGAVLWYLQPSAFAGMSWLQIGIGGPLAIYGGFRMRTFVGANPEAADTAA
jgi:hypothetical protein